MKPFSARLLKGSLVLGLAIVIGVFLVARGQGSSAVHWDALDSTRVVFDSDGIPTVDGADWEKVVETQGLVTASDRLWQMDLMRRFVSGRLSEWYGDNALTVK